MLDRQDRVVYPGSRSTALNRSPRDIHFRFSISLAAVFLLLAVKVFTYAMSFAALYYFDVWLASERRWRILPAALRHASPSKTPTASLEAHR